MPSITSLNFNDLPEEVHKTFFDLFNPIERTLVLSTCKKWHDLIIETKAWWRELVIEEFDSMADISRMFAIFNQRSGNSLTWIEIDKQIETKRDLKRIFSLIAGSSSTVKFLTVRHTFELGQLSRQLSQKLPELRFLSTGPTASSFTRVHWMREEASRLRCFHIGDLEAEELEEQELEWLSHLKELRVEFLDNYSLETFWSLLRACGSSLGTLWLFKFTWRGDGNLPVVQPVVMDVLSELTLATQTLAEPPVILALVAPNLKILTCRLPQLQAVHCPSLECLSVKLEMERESWNEEQTKVAIQQFKVDVIARSTIRDLRIIDYNDQKQVQLQTAFQSLICPTDETQKAPLPNLTKLQIEALEEVSELENLIEVAVSRERYISKMTGTEAFEVVFRGNDPKSRFTDRLEKARREMVSTTSD